MKPYLVLIMGMAGVFSGGITGLIGASRVTIIVPMLNLGFDLRLKS